MVKSGVFVRGIWYACPFHRDVQLVWHTGNVDVPKRFCGDQKGGGRRCGYPDLFHTTPVAQGGGTIQKAIQEEPYHSYRAGPARGYQQSKLRSDESENGPIGRFCPALSERGRLCPAYGANDGTDAGQKTLLRRGRDIQSRGAA